MTSVYILATCLNGNLDPTLLTFKTLRVGFPTATVTVFGNGLAPEEWSKVAVACEATGCAFVALPRVAHDVWIQQLLAKRPHPFWICDTDVVFHSSVEGFVNGDTMLKGRHEPAFVEPWSKTQKAERLHTCLLYMNAPALRHSICTWLRQWHPSRFPFSPMTELVRQCYVPNGAGKPPKFYDTCAGLYLALGGEGFTEEENAAFDHLHCATYVDRMKDAVPGLAAAHGAIYQNTEESRHLKSNQQEFYARQQYA